MHGFLRSLCYLTGALYATNVCRGLYQVHNPWQYIHCYLDKEPRRIGPIAKLKLDVGVLLYSAWRTPLVVLSLVGDPLLVAANRMSNRATAAFDWRGWLTDLTTPAHVYVRDDRTFFLREGPWNSMRGPWREEMARSVLDMQKHVAASQARAGPSSSGSRD